jgi:hypothetical protein
MSTRGVLLGNRSLSARPKTCAPGGPLALRFLTLFRDPVLNGPTNLRRDRPGRPLLNPTQRGELFRLEKNLKARSVT